MKGRKIIAGLGLGAAVIGGGALIHKAEPWPLGNQDNYAHARTCIKDGDTQGERELISGNFCADVTMSQADVRLHDDVEKGLEIGSVFVIGIGFVALARCVDEMGDCLEGIAEAFESYNSGQPIRSR